ncbi:ribonuclease H [Sesbania bispinosa]|nr:ribonuclease H [Sesbania bispinosa]
MTINVSIKQCKNCKLSTQCGTTSNANFLAVKDSKECVVLCGTAEVRKLLSQNCGTGRRGGARAHACPPVSPSLPPTLVLVSVPNVVFGALVAIMDTWKHIQLTEEEEANVVNIANLEEELSVEKERPNICIVFKLWTIDSFNVRAFKAL